MSERELVLADLAEIESLLSQISSERVFERVGLEGKRSELQAQLARLQHADAGAKVVLFFGGAPVVGSTGIEAPFAAKALARFEKAVMRVHGPMRRNRPDARGPQPPEPRLYFTSTAAGSFGFELRELQAGMLEGSELAGAVESTIDLIAAAAASDDEFADAIAEQSKKVAAAVRDFLDVLDEEHATLRLVGDREVQLSVRTAAEAAERARRIRVDEDEEEFSGKFKGTLGGSRVFELQLAGGSLIKGELASYLNPNELVRYYDHECLAVVRAIHVRHPGRTHTRYTLISLMPLEPMKVKVTA